MSNLLRSMMGKSGLSFGHLAGLPSRGARAEDDKPGPDDDSGKSKKGKRADDDSGGEDDDDDGQNRENGDSKKGKRAEGGEDDDDRDEEEDDDSGKGKKGKRASADDDDDGRAEDDDDDEEEMRGKSAAAAARRRERARCAAIFGSKAAARNPVLAANLAFKTTMTRQQALAVLNETPAPQGAYGARRNPNLGAGGDRGISRDEQVAASWDAAFQKAGATARRGR